MAWGERWGTRSSDLREGGSVYGLIQQESIDSRSVISEHLKHICNSVKAHSEINLRPEHLILVANKQVLVLHQTQAERQLSVGAVAARLEPEQVQKTGKPTAMFSSKS